MSTELRKARKDLVAKFRRNRAEEISRNLEIEEDRFLPRLLEEIEADERYGKSSGASDEQIAQWSEEEGYRTPRIWKEAHSDILQLHRDFVHAEPFKRLWAVLKDDWPEPGARGYSMGRFGMPNLLIQATITWHQAPKFTESMRRKHSEEIAAAAQHLEDLLAQLVPSHDHDEQYSKFRFESDDQAAMLANLLRMERAGRTRPSNSWIAATILKSAGVSPIWAVRQIRDMALDETPTSNPLPAKARAKNAKKTYFIQSFFGALQKANMYSSNGFTVIKPQLAADVIGLMSGQDCNADDVRKARPALRSEDSY